jgi:geranylgeranyl diphosphate synthase type II
VHRNGEALPNPPSHGIILDMVQATPLTIPDDVLQLREPIDEALSAFSEFGTGCPDHLREAIRYSLLAPGKRLRPTLTLLAAQACGASIKSAMPAACAVEMIHAYSLIHDDLPAMDDDDLRRGRPTCHKQFDEATAILAGDALLALAFQTIAEAVEPPGVAARCCAELSRAAGARELVGGQADDLAKQFSIGDLESLEAIHVRKTGAMIRVSLRLGGLVAGADDVQLAALGQYGDRLGLAFQVTDDLLDVRGDEAALGKRVGKDSDRGKVTYPGVLGVDESVRYAAQLVDEACEALVPLGSQAAHLEALARYVLERNH